jgi:hypothetical protein
MQAKLSNQVLMNKSAVDFWPDSSENELIFQFHPRPNSFAK